MRQKELATALMVIDNLAFLAALLFTIGAAPAHIESISLDTDAGSALRHALLPVALLAVVPLGVIWANTWMMGMAMAHDRSFTRANAKRMKNVGIAATAEAAIYGVATTFLPLGAKVDGGTLAVALIVVLACLGLAVVAFAASHLMAKAAEIQSENDLTV